MTPRNEDATDQCVLQEDWKRKWRRTVLRSVLWRFCSVLFCSVLFWKKSQGWSFERILSIGIKQHHWKTYPHTLKLKNMFFFCGICSMVKWSIKKWGLWWSPLKDQTTNLHKGLALDKFGDRAEVQKKWFLFFLALVSHLNGAQTTDICLWEGVFGMCCSTLRTAKHTFSLFDETLLVIGCKLLRTRKKENVQHGMQGYYFQGLRATARDFLYLERCDQFQMYWGQLPVALASAKWAVLGWNSPTRRSALDLGLGIWPCRCLNCLSVTCFFSCWCDPKPFETGWLHQKSG